jgi:hypothetical protein
MQERRAVCDLAWAAEVGGPIWVSPDNLLRNFQGVDAQASEK